MFFVFKKFVQSVIFSLLYLSSPLFAFAPNPQHARVSEVEKMKSFFLCQAHSCLFNWLPISFFFQGSAPLQYATILPVSEKMLPHSRSVPPHKFRVRPSLTTNKHLKQAYEMCAPQILVGCNCNSLGRLVVLILRSWRKFRRLTVSGMHQGHFGGRIAYSHPQLLLNGVSGWPMAPRNLCETTAS